MAQLSASEAYLVDTENPKDVKDIIRVTNWIYQSIPIAAVEGSHLGHVWSPIDVLERQIRAFGLGVAALETCPETYLKGRGIYVFSHDRDVLQAELDRLRPPVTSES